MFSWAVLNSLLLEKWPESRVYEMQALFDEHHSVLILKPDRKIKNFNE